MKLRMQADGRLLLTVAAGENARPVSVRRCFPWSEPLAWLSLRDEEGGEAALIENADELDLVSREDLGRALSEASFVFRIESIVSIEEEFELRKWRVRLADGERIFQTRLMSWPRELGGGTLVVQDVANDLYVIPDPEGLDQESQKKLWAFLDD